MNAPLCPTAAAKAHRASLEALDQAERFHASCPAELVPVARMLLARARAFEADARQAWASALVQ